MELLAAPYRWSIAECMEHIAASEDYICGSLETGVVKAAAIPGRDVAALDAGIIASAPDRSHRVQAPEAIKATHRFGSSQAAIDHFVESRAATETFLKTTAGPRDHAVDSPTARSGTPTNSSS